TSVELDPRDEAKEAYAKGSLPLNVKTPFWQVFKYALSDREKMIFRELYGNAAKRGELYKLAKPGADASAGSKRLFPHYTHVKDIDRFHLSPLTWDVFIDHLLSGLPWRVTKANSVPRKNHKLGDEILIAPLSGKIDYALTDPLIAIELRRIGFDHVPLGAWKGLMSRGARELPSGQLVIGLRALAKLVNS
ncbi:MAG: hypothetical protein ACREX8_14390, partial [Gammaproteobacteria bacterium]